MRISAEEFLYTLLWGAEALARPSVRNALESFEGWASRTGVLRQLHRLERRRLVERMSNNVGCPVEQIYRLTEIGRLAALGGRDPEQRWARHWDRKWRIITFDLPEKQNGARVKLRRYLKERGFGYFQKSVWISPDPLEEDLKNLSLPGKSVQSLSPWEATSCAGEIDASIVIGSWDFERIGRLHGECLRILRNPPWKNKKSRDVALLREWASEERAAWNAVIEVDPFLPSMLLPKGYLGREVWRLRNVVLREAGHR